MSEQQEPKKKFRIVAYEPRVYEVEAGSDEEAKQLILNGGVDFDKMLNTEIEVIDEQDGVDLACPHNCTFTYPGFGNQLWCTRDGCTQTKPKG